MMDSLDIPILVSRENGPWIQAIQTRPSKRLEPLSLCPYGSGHQRNFCTSPGEKLNPQCRLFLESSGVGLWRTYLVAHFCPPPKGPQKERILVFQLYHFFFWGGKLAVKLLGCNKIGTIFLNDPAVWTTNLIPANGKSSFSLGRVSERLQVIKNKYGTGYLPLVPCHQDSCQPDFIIFDTC